MRNFSHLDSELIRFLDEASRFTRIADVLNFGHERNFNKIGDFFKKEDMNHVSFIPIGKMSSEHNGFDEVKKRQKIRIGRFIKKIITESAILDYDISNREIEIFVNFYKSYFDRDLTRLKIVEGDDILKYYHEDNYATPFGERIGQLWKSCMRYSDKNHYMKIYSNNPEVVKMLVLLDEEGKVKTRALLWESAITTLGKEYKVMDRIYSVHDHDIVFFKKWALENGYIHKFEQSNKTENLFFTNNGLERINLIIPIKNHKFEYYPYIDSFKWYCTSGYLCNTSNIKHQYKLVQNDGSLYREEDIQDEFLLDEFEVDEF
jgi:hypothetical protein